MLEHKNTKGIHLGEFLQPNEITHFDNILAALEANGIMLPIPEQEAESQRLLLEKPQGKWEVNAHTNGDKLISFFGPRFGESYAQLHISPRGNAWLDMRNPEEY